MPGQAARMFGVADQAGIEPKRLGYIDNALQGVLIRGSDPGVQALASSEEDGREFGPERLPHPANDRQ